MPCALSLREVIASDLAVFFENQLDPLANHMAAFTAKDPTDHAAFTAHWARIMADPSVIIRTIVCDRRVAGSVLSYEEGGRPEVSYWIGRSWWNQGIATMALKLFLEQVNPKRPMYARVAKDNPGSIRVLEKCGFRPVGEAMGYAHARGREIPELLLEL